MFEVNNLTVRYGAATAINNINIKLKTGHIACVIGPNGAGKTTLIRAICNQVPISSGKIRLGKCLLNELATYQIANAGVIQCPEGRDLFGDLTVKENLILGSLPSKRSWTSTENQETFEMLVGLFPAIKKLLSRKANTLSGGEQQMVALARSVMGMPKVLLLDEPSLGLAPSLVDNVMKAIPRIAAKMHSSVVIVEQNVVMALKVATTSYWLQSGELLFSGTCDNMEEYIDTHVKLVDR